MKEDMDSTNHQYRLNSLQVVFGEFHLQDPLEYIFEVIIFGKDPKGLYPEQIVEVVFLISKVNLMNHSKFIEST